jgi:DNA-binding response OmpR family regulator
MKSRILLLEDDAVLSLTLEDLLQSEGYDVELVKDGEEAVDLAYDNRYDLYLFDVNVPSLNGFDLLKALREADDTTPAVFITALSDIASLTKGFDSGADDYIKKPFDPDELLVRIAAKIKQAAPRLACGDVSMDTATHTVYKGEKIIDIGEVPRAILKLLMERQGQNVDKSSFYDVMENPSDAAIRVHITKLKQALGLEITNIRGMGYRLETA